ncbi:hypothetical protein DRN73_08310 [Candidatus Pacearchaeota archaeon]|nr:MAG: hypothetical protein DRN73_08310 [Candidatus Pacearchaeota archaeon]
MLKKMLAVIIGMGIFGVGCVKININDSWRWKFKNRGISGEAGFKKDTTIIQNLKNPSENVFEIKTIGGKVEISCWNKNQILVKAKIYGDAEVFKEYKNNKFYIETVFPKEIKIKTGRVDYQIKIPQNLKKVSIKTVSGDVRGENLVVREKIFLRTVSGDMEIKKIKVNYFKVATTSGDGSIEGIFCSDVSVSSVSGDFKLSFKGLVDNTKLSSVSGDYEVYINKVKEFKFKSVSGDLDIYSQTRFSDVKFSSTSGNYRETRGEYLYPKSDAILRATTVSGDVKIHPVK